MGYKVDQDIGGCNAGSSVIYRRAAWREKHSLWSYFDFGLRGRCFRYSGINRRSNPEVPYVLSHKTHWICRFLAETRMLVFALLRIRHMRHGYHSVACEGRSNQTPFPGHAIFMNLRTVAVIDVGCRPEWECILKVGRFENGQIHPRSFERSHFGSRSSVASYQRRTET